MSDTLGLVKYDAMVLAIAACHHVDEVKDIRDKARAIEVYAAQALNREAEEQAAEIRIRAERKTGELVKEGQQSGLFLKAGDKGPTDGRGARPSVAGKQSLADLGITKDQSSQWQKLAEIPEPQFEQLVTNRDSKPSTEGILEAARPTKHIPPLKYDRDALMAHGHIMDFRDIMLKPAPELFVLMQDFQQRQLESFIPQLIDWLKEMR